ncbi:MAG TPA: DUF1080 domain-containing protein [Roseimicrobium sp.]|nr:DUF1080 domain-containing protein [Roseimicrobium sp.]
MMIMKTDLIYRFTRWASAISVVFVMAGGCGTCNCTVRAAEVEKPGKWQMLFDGKKVEGLRGYAQESMPTNSWEISKKTLHAIPGKGIDLITTEKFTDFELLLEWKVSPGGNSGVMYRVTEIAKDKPWFTGPEMQILDDALHPDGKNPKTSAGALYALMAPNESKKLKAVGSWNKASIIFKGSHAEHWLNGKKVVEYTWASQELEQLIVQSKFKDKPRFMKEAEGRICIQHHGQEVWLRNIRIRRL